MAPLIFTLSIANADSKATFPGQWAAMAARTIKLKPWETAHSGESDIFLSALKSRQKRMTERLLGAAGATNRLTLGPDDL